jgi:hypothetical protein
MDDPSRHNLIKWRLMVTTFPLTVVVVVVKVVLETVLQFHGLVDFAEISLVITGGIFLMGFMLAGTLSDYKESERIPAEMACALESIEDTFRLAWIFKSQFDLKACQRQVLDLTDTIIKYFHHQESEAEVYRQLDKLSEIAVFVERTGMGSTTSWVKREQANLRQLFARMTVIKRTHFISTGYAFLEVLSVVIAGLLLISRFDNLIISIILVSFITQIFVYMVLLIKDIDHPFEYPADGKVRAADIDLFPLMEYRQRAEERQRNE